MQLLLTQDRKIAIAVISIFLISFSVMMFFLQTGEEINMLNASTMHSTEAGESQDKAEASPKSLEEAPYFSISSDGKFTQASSGFLELLDIRELQGESLYDFVHIKDLTKLFSHQTRVIQDKEKIEAVGPIRLINGDNESIVLFTIIPIEQDHKVNELKFEVNDITAQVQEMTDDQTTPDENQKTLRKKDHETSRLMVDKISYLTD